MGGAERHRVARASGRSKSASGIVGRIVGSLVGLAWSLVTFLVLPVLVIEQIGPIQAVKRSAELFKHTWGENMIANAGIGIVALVATLVGVLPCLLLIAVGGPVGGPRHRASPSRG